MLTLCDKNIKSLDDEAILDAAKYTYLDVSRNDLNDGAGFRKFKNLKVLILDNNNFYTLDGFPNLPQLETLSINGNKFSEADQFLDEVCLKFPNVIHLSTMKNIMNPIFTSEEKYEIYKSRFAAKLPKLRNLDGFDLTLEKYNHRRPTLNENPTNEPSPYQKRGKGKAIGFQVSEEVKDEDGEANASGETRKLLTVIEYNEKYDKRAPNKNLRLKSEGNRFVKNDQL